MRADEITVEVKAKLEVSRSTAEGCLKLLEIYLNEHSDSYLCVVRNDDGTDSYSIREYSTVKPKGEEHE